MPGELDEQILEVKINPQEKNTVSDTSTNKDTLSSKEKESQKIYENEETKLIRNDFAHYVEMMITMASKLISHDATLCILEHLTNSIPHFMNRGGPSSDAQYIGQHSRIFWRNSSVRFGPEIPQDTIDDFIDNVPRHLDACISAVKTTLAIFHVTFELKSGNAKAPIFGMPDLNNMLTKYQMIKFIDFCEVWFLPESVARGAAIVGGHRCHTPRH
ncbi:hypothetical protein TNCV_3466191 [Trichonephila clavipes]|nr:hypothetical protein TNCV_3466191 [Trichonephila clavipes]